MPSQDRLFETPGAHASLLGIFAHLAKPGETVLCEALTYPGMRAIAAQLGLSMNDEGIDPDAFAKACRAQAEGPLPEPMLQNPTTLTVPRPRRDVIATVARRFHVPIVEDDAHGFIPSRSVPPFAAFAPDLTWHIAGLAKCIGAGLRTAYVVMPDTKSAWPFAAALRTATVMVSPFTAVATRWIEDGTADAILRFIRTETAARQAMAASLLPPDCFRADPMSFNLWVTLPRPWTRSAFMMHMRSTGIGIVASDSFTVGGTPPEAVRVCLGGPIGRDDLRRAFEFIAHSLVESPARASSFL